MPATRARRTRVVLETATRHEAERVPIVVIKVGGSLLTSPQLTSRLEWLLDRRSNARVVLLTGGGATADIVRQWQSLHGLSEEESHRLALEAMAFNELLLQTLMPQCCLAGDLEEIEQAWSERLAPVLRTRQFVREMELTRDERIPQAWEMTSDSIAAWCGDVIGASELILAKSVDLPSDATLESARNDRLVDRRFGTERYPQRVSWVNLRAERPTLIEWL